MGFFYNGGGERTVLNEAIGLMERGHQVSVHAPIVTKDCFPDLQKKVEINQIIDLPESTPAREGLSMIASCFKAPLQELGKNDALLAHGQPSNWIAVRAKRRYKKPVVAYHHQVNRFFKPRKVDHNSWKNDDSLRLLNMIHKGNLPLKTLDRFTVQSSDVVVTNSKWIKNQIQEYYKIDPIVCYPGVDVKKTAAPRKTGQQYILTTNRHQSQKRIDYLIKIMKTASKQNPRLKAVVTGGYTKHTEELIKLRDRLGLQEKVTFTGNISNKDLETLYSGAACYVYTSPEEDFGLGPLEAASFGVPTVAWNYAGPKETVINGETGFLAEPYDMDDMTCKITQLLEDPALRDRMGAAAKKHVERFSWENHVEKLEKILVRATDCY